ncbi:MAG: alpha/beta fold hydrolase [Methanoregula sp.]
MPRVHVNDITMYYEIFGEGEPLLVIQGMGVDISSVAQMNKRLGEKYRVIVFDSRGTGRTDKPDIPYSIEMMVGDTLGLMDTLGIRKAHVLGISMGSMIAVALAADHPERVKGLVLHVAFHRVAFLMKTIWSIMWSTDAGRKKMMAMSDFIFRQQYPPTPESFFRQGQAPLPFDGRDLLPLIKAPTLIINGTHDQAVPMKITRELAAGIPGAKLVLIEGDHLFAAKEPDLLLKPALAFLGEVDAKPEKIEVDKP